MEPEALGGADALGLLLATESFLLAAVGVALAVEAPQRAFVARFNARWGATAVSLTSIFMAISVGIAAVFSWAQIYGGGSIRPLDEFVIAAGLFVALIGQPILTVWFAVGMLE